MDQNKVKTTIKELVEKYEQLRLAGKIKDYNEEETKKDFILPLFEALGWSVYNKKEVSAEEFQKSGGRVDYGFYLDGRAKFYLEAKSLPADLNREEFAKQAIKYSWNKGITWAILTDFESIKVFNAQYLSSNLGDKLFFEISYNKYIERFDQLGLLSKESFEKNALDLEGEKYGKKLATVSVNKSLIDDLNECRAILTHSLGQWNPTVHKDLLDEGVQKLLDRLIFIRVAEDREVEPKTLMPLVREWESSGRKTPLYESMVSKFRELDKTYDSNLFSEHPFEKWDEYGGATQKVIKILYGKEGYYEYDFKIIPADVLGSVYENYLGYKLSQSKKNLTISKDAKKRKEGGIYYTPDYIVDFIVKNTLKPVLDNCRSIEDVKKLKILDPACGSGSFLIKALNVISEKYEEFGYKEEYLNKFIILTENLYGVDLDEQAVEIARLNLLINSLSGQMKLPLLNHNIKNGNSLISGSDEELKKYFGGNYRDKKPFNWKVEFPEVFKQGGFDVIIGNPPYISAVQESKNDSRVHDYYRDIYSLKGAFDIYIAFLIKGVDISNKEGCFGWIVPNKLMVAEYAKDTLKYLRENGLYSVIDVSELNIFGNVGVYPIIVLGNKKRKDFVENTVESVEDLQNSKFKSQTRSSQYKTFKDFGVKISSGATGFQAELLTSYLSEVQNSSGAIPFVVSGSIDPYSVSLEDVRYMGKNYKRAFITKGDGIAESKWNFWSRDKIVVSGMTKRIEAFFSKKPLALGVGIYGIYDYAGFDPYFLLAILNSSFLTYFLKKEFKHKHLAGSYLAINKSTIEQFPIVKPYISIERELVEHAKKVILLTEKLNNCVNNSNESENLKLEIENINKKIDEEVYKLYELTPGEIEIVKGGKNEQ